MVYVRIYVLVLATAIFSATRVEGGAKLVRKSRSVPGSYLVAMKSDTTDEQLNEFVKKLDNLRHPDNPYEISRVRGLRAVARGITAELNQDALELVSHGRPPAECFANPASVWLNHSILWLGCKS